jgi:hypothetical protein
MAKIKGANLEQAQPKLGADKTAVDPMDDYEAKGHLDTLMNAHEIMNNPAKMAKVHALAGAKKSALKGISAIPNINVVKPDISSVDDIKSYRQNKFGGKGGVPKIPLSTLAGGGQGSEETED